MKITPLPIFDDNYIWIIEDKKKGCATCVDPGLSEPVINYLTEHDLDLEAILITHHHIDHIGGLKDLKRHYPKCQIIKPIEQRIGVSTQSVSHDESIRLTTCDLTFKVIETPGHTSSHICYYAQHDNESILFSGDTLFSGGCGRLFEGSPEQMLSSLHKLMQFPGNTKVYCTHEYTRSNLKFYQHISKNNAQLNEYIETLKAQEEALSLPTTLTKEMEINPFLRCATTEFKEVFKNEIDLSEIALFTKVRQLKDNF